MKCRYCERGATHRGILGDDEPGEMVEEVFTCVEHAVMMKHAERLDDDDGAGAGSTD